MLPVINVVTVPHMVYKNQEEFCDKHSKFLVLQNCKYYRFTEINNHFNLKSWTLDTRRIELFVKGIHESVSSQLAPNKITVTANCTVDKDTAGTPLLNVVVSLDGHKLITLPLMLSYVYWPKIDKNIISGIAGGLIEDASELIMNLAKQQATPVAIPAEKPVISSSTTTEPVVKEDLAITSPAAKFSKLDKAKAEKQKAEKTKASKKTKE